MARFASSAPPPRLTTREEPLRRMLALRPATPPLQGSAVRVGVVAEKEEEVVVP